MTTDDGHVGRHFSQTLHDAIVSVLHIHATHQMRTPPYIEYPSSNPSGPPFLSDPPVPAISYMATPVAVSDISTPHSSHRRLERVHCTTSRQGARTCCPPEQSHMRTPPAAHARHVPQYGYTLRFRSRPQNTSQHELYVPRKRPVPMIPPMERSCCQ